MIEASDVHVQSTNGVAPVAASAASVEARTGMAQGWYTWTSPSDRPMAPSKFPSCASSRRTSDCAWSSLTWGATKAPR